MPYGTIRIEGLAAFRRDLRAIDPQMQRGVREALKRVVEPVAVRTRAKAPKRSGKLAGSVKTFTRGNVAGVRVTATRSSRSYPNYPYPRRLEFERGGARAFLRPAVEASGPDLTRAMDRFLDDIADTWGG